MVQARKRKTESAEQCHDLVAFQLSLFIFLLDSVSPVVSSLPPCFPVHVLSCSGPPRCTCYLLDSSSLCSLCITVQIPISYNSIRVVV